MRAGAARGPRKTRPTCGTVPSTLLSPGSKTTVQSLSSVIWLRSTAALPTVLVLSASIDRLFSRTVPAAMAKAPPASPKGSVPAST